jgi:hypothetical protein
MIVKERKRFVINYKRNNMIEEKLERDIRKHLQDRFHVYMKHYVGQALIHKQYPYHVDIIFENKKTKSQIRVTNIVYDIYQKAYLIGEIKMVQLDEQTQKEIIP